MHCIFLNMVKEGLLLLIIINYCTILFIIYYYCTILKYIFMHIHIAYICHFELLVPFLNIHGGICKVQTTWNSLTDFTGSFIWVGIYFKVCWMQPPLKKYTITVIEVMKGVTCVESFEAKPIILRFVQKTFAKLVASY